MSLDAASANLPGVPDELVMRSARARAAAQGTDVDAVLASWGGGADLPAAAAPTSAPSGGEEAASPEPPAAPAAVATTTAPAAPAVAAPPPREVIYVLPEEAPIADPAAVGDRVRTGVLLGGALGAMTGLLAGIAAFGLASGGMVVVDEAPGMAVDPTRTLIVLGIIFALAGLVIGRIVATLPARFDPGREIDFRGGVIGTLGLVLGGAFGIATAGLIGGGGTEIVGEDTLVGVRAVGSFVTIGLAAIVMGAVVGVLAQLVTLPKGLDEASEESSEQVQKRLVTGYMVPIVVLVSMALIIIGVGTLFLQFPAISPVVAIFIAGSILTFGFMSTSRPNTKISGTDVAIFVAGLAIIIVFVGAVAWQIGGGGHGGEDDEHGGETEQTTDEAPVEDAFDWFVGSRPA